MIQWFDDIPVAGQLSTDEVMRQLNPVNSTDTPPIQSQFGRPTNSRTFGSSEQKRWRPLSEKLWRHTAHTFGYLAPSVEPAHDVLPITSIDGFKADTTLQDSRIRITLDRLRVVDYPGRGTHRILLHFFAQNQLPNQTEDLHFNATYRVRDGEHAAIRGYPIFVGLSVGKVGIRLKCRTINVQNDQDEAFLSMLESETFNAGLQLATTAQPAIAPLSTLAYSVARMVATRHRNISVQDFDLGLDFSTLPMGARLAEGTYVAVQIPESAQIIWDWSEWGYYPTTGMIAKKTKPLDLIPYNYLVFGISRFQGHEE